jgi:hypothetical protein
MSNIKDTPLDNLQNEISKEKFSALRRISENLSSSLQALEIVDGKIKKSMKDNFSVQDINKMIDAYNRLREDAEEWRYYLTVTREASGFFNSELTAGIYKIPPRKRKIKDGYNNNKGG